MPTDSFWLDRWEEGRTHFHRDAVDPGLIQHADWLLGPHTPVLVPLCGKTLDLRWLQQSGHATVGIELSERAIHEVIAAPTIRECATHRAFVDDDLELWQGDFFAIRTDRRFGAVWDRAALVAVDPDQRPAYARQLRALAPGGRLLLSTISYDPAVMSGPPFSVTAEALNDLFGAGNVTQVEQTDRIDVEPRWRERGHSWFRVGLYRILLGE